MADQSLDEKRLQLERERMEQEVRIKQQELEVRREEIRISRGGRKEKILNAVLTVLGFIGGAVTQGILNRDIERQKLQSSLITTAIGTSDPREATKNLLFFHEIGFIDDPSGQIAALRNKPDEAPVLPRQSAAIQKSRPIQLRITGNASTIQVAIDSNIAKFNEDLATVTVEEKSRHAMVWTAVGTPGSTYAISVLDQDKELFKAPGEISAEGFDFGSAEFILPSKQ